MKTLHLSIIGISIVVVLMFSLPESFELGSGSIARSSILSPLKQFKSGTISILDIKCAQGFDRLIKTSDGSPACVKPSSVKKLIERGWATRTINVKNTDFEINYSIKGGELTGATEDLHPQELILSLRTSYDGNLTVNIPKGLFEFIHDYWTNGDIKVFADGTQVDYKEKKSAGYVVLTFALKSGTTKVEIIPSISALAEEKK